MSTSLEAVKSFLACKRLAMVGVSRNPSDFSSKLFQELVRHDFDVIPVNPNAKWLLGKFCFAHVQDIHPAVESVMLMTPSDVTESVVRDCASAGVKKVWMYRAGGTGAVSAKAVQYCRAHGIEVIPGECPLMFLEDTGVVHRLHGLFRKLTGKYPASAAA